MSATSNQISGLTVYLAKHMGVRTPLPSYYEVAERVAEAGWAPETTRDLPEGVPEEIYLVRNLQIGWTEVALSPVHALSILGKAMDRTDDTYTVTKLRVVEATPVELKLVPLGVSDQDNPYNDPPGPRALEELGYEGDG
jgi:hypothetical protein